MNYRNISRGDGFIGALILPEAANYSRKQLDLLNEYIKELGGAGIAHFKKTGQELDGGISKFLSAEEKIILREF